MPAPVGSVKEAIMSKHEAAKTTWFEPNFRRHFHGEIDSQEQAGQSRYTAIIGITEGERPLTVSLSGFRSAPHLLVAGMTGSGKSYLMSQIVTQLLLQYGPAELQLAIIDPVVDEHSVWHRYRSLPHLFAPRAQKHSDAVKLVERVATEMDRRYALLESAEANSIDEYNGRHDPLPHLLLVIDELSGLADSESAGVSKTFREQIAAIARKGRAAGIMLLIGVQRPSEETLSEDLLGNLTNRIALRLLTAGESEMVLGEEANDAAMHLEPVGDGICTLDGERTRFSPLFMPIKPADRRGEGETYPLLGEYLDKIATHWRP